MNKFYITICFCLSFLLLSSCERPDLTEDVESAYDYAKMNYSGSGSDSGSCISNLDCPLGKWCSDGFCIDRENEEDGNECTTIDGNMWSQKASDSTWNDAVDYCDNLTACGYSDWHLPTISELRTLIQNCSGTVTGGNCGVTDSCLSNDCGNGACDGCGNESGGYYCKLGDTGWFWSSSTQSDATDYAWYMGFSFGRVGKIHKSYSFYVRCVRNAE